MADIVKATTTGELVAILLNYPHNTKIVIEVDEGEMSDGGTWFDDDVRREVLVREPKVGLSGMTLRLCPGDEV